MPIFHPTACHASMKERESLLDQQAHKAGVFEVANTLDHLPTSPRDTWTRCPE